MENWGGQGKRGEKFPLLKFFSIFGMEYKICLYNGIVDGVAQ